MNLFLPFQGSAFLSVPVRIHEGRAFKQSFRVTPGGRLITWPRDSGGFRHRLLITFVGPTNPASHGSAGYSDVLIDEDVERADRD